MALLDTVIRGGTILDGSGDEPFAADIGFAGGRIAVLGSVPASDAHEVVDATGMCVAPGFIDLHTHTDLTIHGAPAAETYLRQGVTLMQMGNCGFSPFPIAATAGAIQSLRSNIAVLATGLPWDWTDMTTFAGSVTSRRPGINFAVQVGHHAIRLAVMGADDRRATEAELEKMAAEVRRAADAGATGVSFGLIYAPGSFADRRELEAVARAAAECGLLVSCHIRNETDHVLDAVDEILDVAAVSGARMQLSHVKAMAEPNHGKVVEAIGRIATARRAGVDVTTDVYPYTASSTTLTSRLSNWAMSGGVGELLRKLGDVSARDRIVSELGTRIRFDVNPDGVVIAGIGAGPDRWVIGRSLTEIGREWRVSPAEAAIRVIADHEGSVQIINHSMSEWDIEAALAYEYCAVASDGSQLSVDGVGMTHPRSFGTFPRVLSRYVRERGVLSLSEAVHRMTSLPAARMGLTGRGRLHVGAHADAVVFDAESIADLSTYADPWRLSVGVRDVFVGGLRAVAGGEVTSVRAGRFVGR